jgi:hypothetical protein
MNKEFVTYEQALALKDLGFDEPCFGYWNIDPYLPNPTFNLVKPFDHEWCIPAPLYQQAFRWFREKHNLFCEIQMDRTTEPKFCFVIFKYEHFGNYEKVEVDEWYLYRTYEEAEQVCLTKLIEITNAEIKNRG